MANDRVQRRPTAALRLLLGVRWNPRLGGAPRKPCLDTEPYPRGDSKYLEDGSRHCLYRWAIQTKSVPIQIGIVHAADAFQPSAVMLL